MTERSYPVRNPRHVDNQQKAFETKLINNRKRGYDAFTSGHVEPFQGYTKERLGGEFEFKLELALSTLAVIDNVYYGSALDYHVKHASPQLK